MFWCVRQAQKQGAVVQNDFSKDTMFAIVEPLTQPLQLQGELAGLDRCQASVNGPCAS
jgi:hypothetical protein